MRRRAWLAGAAMAALAGLAVARRAAGGAERLLWWEGTAVRWNAGRGVVLTAAGELLIVHRGTRIRELPLVPAGRPLLEATAKGDGVIWLVDGGGTVVRRAADGTLAELGRTGFDIPALAAGPAGLWAARSPTQFTFRPESAGGALAIRLDTALDAQAGAGAATVPDNPFMTQLTNASRILPLGDGGVVVAPFVRDLVIRFDSAGREVWRTRRGLDHETPNPAMLVREEDGRQRVVADYAPVNLGLAEGPDGTIYVLSTVAARTDSSRLDALDPETGAVIRTRRYGTALPTLVADAAGAVRIVEAADLRPAAPAPAEREAFAPFALPTPDGDTLRLAGFAGRIVVVNLWASWCGPCREEFPALDSLAARFDTARVRFVGLSEDVSRGAAERFLAEHPVQHIAIAFGDGRLKSRYHYIGLPHTALLDGQGRVIRHWVGFTGRGQIEAIGELIRSELGSGGHVHSRAPSVP